MTANQIRFEDGASYERYMGTWSRLVGEAFLDWLSPPAGKRWLDVGCGNGAFTDLITQRCEPASIDGIDPSEAQLAYARSHLTSSHIRFHRGDAMWLPFPDGSFDIAVMPLVISFVREPAVGVAEMKRVVSAGGIVAAYMWDMTGGGFPYATVHSTLRAQGVSVPSAPSSDASRQDSLVKLWTGAGLTDVETNTLAVQRMYVHFEDYWETILLGPSTGAPLAALSAGDRARLAEVMRAELLPATDSTGRIIMTGRANVVRGHAN